MNELQEIPKFIRDFSITEAAIWTVVVFVVTVVIASVILIRSNNKKRSDDYDRQSNMESIGQGFVTGLIVGFIASVVFVVVSVNSGNLKTVKASVFHNISEVYTVDFKIEDIKTSYSNVATNQNGSFIEEATTTYDDLDTGTRYDLVFVFKGNKEPVLLKTGNVTDEFIASMKK